MFLVATSVAYHMFTYL